MELSLNISGHRTSDLADALREALRVIEAGSLSGGDSNDTGSYNFEVTGSPVEEYAIRSEARPTTARRNEKRYSVYEEAREACGPSQVVVGLQEDGECLIS